MAHIHKLTDVIDGDSYFEIDVDSRTIVDRNTIATVLMQGDHNSERITFRCRRTIDNHDLNDCDRIEIHFINTGSTGKSNDGLYLATDKVIDDTDNTKMLFTWLVSDQATMYNGALSFAIKFICSSEKATEYGKETTFDYVWSTAIYSSIQVGKGMDNAQSIVSRYADVIAMWYNEFVIKGDAAIKNLNDTIENKITTLTDDYFKKERDDAVKVIETTRDNAMDEINRQVNELTSIVLDRAPKAEEASF